jgi:hypothetical protein
MQQVIQCRCNLVEPGFAGSKHVAEFSDLAP